MEIITVDVGFILILRVFLGGIKMKNTFLKAKDYIMKNGTDLQKICCDYVCKNATTDNVQDALAKYLV